MRRVFRFLLPERISSQIALIVVGSLIALHVILTATFLMSSFDQRRGGPPGWRLFDPIMMTVLLIVLLITLLGVWAARTVTSPLRSFAKAAESFSPEHVIAPLSERGPTEVRAAAKALLRERVKNLLDDR